MKVIVYEKEWDRGYGSKGCLLTMHKQLGRDKCCLGFFCQQLGIADGNLAGMGMPDEIGVLDSFDFEAALVPSQLVVVNGGNVSSSQFAKDAAVINDDDGITDETRKIRLTELFKAHGHEIEFVPMTDEEMKDYLKQKEDEDEY